MSKASVKIMLSYDYCHFEVCLGTDDDISLTEVDNLRKEAQRLADKAVEQYKIACREINRQIHLQGEIVSIGSRVKAIEENFPKSEWNEEQRALVKKYQDYQFALNRRYDYQDEWDEPD